MKSKHLILVVASLLMMVFSVCFAYFTLNIVSNNSTISTMSADLKIVFSNGDGSILASDIEPGWSSEVSIFTVKNESKYSYKYNLVFKNLVNTFQTNGYLVYKITSFDGGYNMSEFKDVPKSSVSADIALAYNIELSQGETHSYNIVFKYLNSTENQNVDQGKILSGSIYIEEGTEEMNGDYEETTLGWKILEDNQIRGVRNDFSETFTSYTTGTLFEATEKNVHNTSDTKVYYYAGNTTNNWVKFAGFYWRIIRTNSDGSIRLLYSGTEPGVNTYIALSPFNNTNKDTIHLGYMYGESGTLELNRLNTNDSTIKEVIDKWYSSNLLDYTSYLSMTAVYCNDRSVGDGYLYSSSSYFPYVGKIRLTTKMHPTYDCTNEYDAFSGNNSFAKLTYPIALMTADEVSYAGGAIGGENNTQIWYYLDSSQMNTWLLTPYSANGSGNMVFVIFGGHLSGNEKGRISGYYLATYMCVRPVISIKGDNIYKSGNGSSVSPYEIVLD